MVIHKMFIKKPFWLCCHKSEVIIHTKWSYNYVFSWAYTYEYRQNEIEYTWILKVWVNKTRVYLSYFALIRFLKTKRHTNLKLMKLHTGNIDNGTITWLNLRKTGLQRHMLPLTMITIIAVVDWANMYGDEPRVPKCNEWFMFAD